MAFRIQWEMALDTRFRRVALALLLLGVCGLVFGRTWGGFRAAWMTRDAGGDPAVYERALLYDPSNADYHFTLAEIYHYSAPHADAGRAGEHYEAAVRLNPDRSSHWVELARFRARSGNAAGARDAMEAALERDPNDAWPHWAAANLYLRLGRLSEADAALGRVAALDPSYLEQVLDLAWHVYEDPDVIFKRILPDTRAANLTALHYFVQRDSESGAARAWNRLEKFETSPSERLAYVDYLVAGGKPHEAWQVFRSGPDGPGDPTDHVFNGSFEYDLLNGGFDWRFTSWDHALIERDTSQSMEGGTSLRIDFDGEENIDYAHLWHWLPVEAGRHYTLSFWIETREVSTDEGIFIEVDGETSEPRLGTSPWERIGVPFVASSDLVTVRVRRRPSVKFDNQLSGRVWLDGFHLEESPGDEASD